jgi:hypothetical protein
MMTGTEATFGFSINLRSILAFELVGVAGTAVAREV